MCFKHSGFRIPDLSFPDSIRNPEKQSVRNPFQSINLWPGLPPVSSDYEAQGSEFTLGDNLKIYETKDKSSKVVLICAYDIFGYHSNTKQFCDKLNSGGVFRVAVPDFFRGQAFSLDNFPPKEYAIFFAS